MRIVLASSSPRRKELMKFFKLPYEIIFKDTLEEVDPNLDCYHNCMNVAQNKAKVVFDDISSDVLVIGSDTMVICDGKIYGKPKDLMEAYEMVKSISGGSHEVVSSLCVMIRKENQVFTELTYDKAVVHVSNLSDEEIYDWINNNDVLTRAGAYAIQDGFCKYIEKIEGDYFSLVGLPVHKLYTVFKKYNIK